MWALINTIAGDAAGASTWSQLWPPIIAAAGMIAVGVVTQFGTLRTSSRTAQAQRDAQLDERADRQYERAQNEIKELRERCVVAERERDDYRERWTRLRLDVMAAGLDPDNLTRSAS